VQFSLRRANKARARRLRRSGETVKPTTSTSGWTCPSCAQLVATPFCPGCGERPLLPRDLSLRGVFDKVLQALTSIDGRMIRTLRALLGRPGSLTLAFQTGQRRPYLGPIQVFLLANVIFFGAQTLTHLNVFSSPLGSHLHDQDWSALAQQMVAHHLAEKQTTLAAITATFDRSAVFNAKWLVILMALAFALALPLASPHSRRPFATHVVFALHVYAFLLLLFSAGVSVAAASALIGGPSLTAPAMDNALSLLLLAASAAYLYVAVGVVYGGTPAGRLAKTALLSLYAAALVLGYRFLIFAITLAFT